MVKHYFMSYQMNWVDSRKPTDKIQNAVIKEHPIFWMINLNAEMECSIIFWEEISSDQYDKFKHWEGQR